MDGSQGVVVEQVRSALSHCGWHGIKVRGETILAWIGLIWVNWYTGPGYRMQVHVRALSDEGCLVVIASRSWFRAISDPVGASRAHVDGVYDYLLGSPLSHEV
jgi:hypothetical protein